MMESLKRKFRYRLFRQTWNIGVINQPVHVVAGLKGEALQRQALEAISWMDEVRGTFKADPFLAPGNDESEILALYEHYDWPLDKGKINAVRWDGSKFGQPGLSLDSTHHLSYPYVYAEDDTIFFMPEHAAAGEVSRYRFDGTGKALDKVTILPKHEFVDSTLMKHQGKYWLFATHAGTTVDSELHLYYSDALSGPWHAHQSNPVKSDPNGARPAGQPFCFKGELFRPGQNCSRSYGENIVVHRIVRLSEQEFVEVPETVIRAPRSWVYDFGLHNISHLGDMTIVDGARLESKLHPALDRFSALVR